MVAVKQNHIFPVHYFLALEIELNIGRFESVGVMAKEMKLLAYYTEFAPAPLIPVRKVSHAPVLETILEEAEECNQDLLLL
ncbi:hypothetical protein ACSQ67_015412 [Phaseolus vulgaris]